MHSYQYNYILQEIFYVYELGSWQTSAIPAPP